MHWTALFLVCWWCFCLLQYSMECVWAWVGSPIASRSPFFSSRRSLCSLTFGRPQSSCQRHASTKPTDKPDDGKLDLRILLIDHYDSFTYNLADLVGQLCVRPPTVLAADCCDSWDEFLLAQRHNQTTPSPVPWDGIILSPGPGHPCDAVTALSRDCVRQNQQLPILGVCLGHQIMGHEYGATIGLAPLPVHGQVRELFLLNEDSRLWKEISPHDIQATRYHSLHVTDLDKAPYLRPTALTKDKEAVLMAMEHVEYPHFGVQFHPESVGTNVGKSLLHNFVHVCEEEKRKREKLERIRGETVRVVPSEVQTTVGSLSTSRAFSSSSPEYSVYVHKISDLPQNGANLHPFDVMSDLLAEEDYSFWLDEARANGQPTVSILGASRQRVEYWGKEKPSKQQGLFVWNNENVLEESTQDMDILTYLQEQHQTQTNSVCIVTLGDAKEVLVESRLEETILEFLPFQFRGGFVGYLGYEIRHDTARFIEEEESGRYHETVQNATTNRIHSPSDQTIPTAAFLWVDRSFVYDNRNGDWYLIGVVARNQEGKGFSKEETFGWMRSMVEYMRRGKHRVGAGFRMPKGSTRENPVFTPNRSRATYIRNFEACIEHIRQGESYELCLTNQLEAEVKVPGSSPLELYNILRLQNPAPHSAFLNWNARKRDDCLSSAAVAICCSSPERFVSVIRRRSEDDVSSVLSVKWQVEAKPIKGTIARVIPSERHAVLTKEEQVEDDARAQRLQSSVKDRAENLMIVDLLRNDLSRVCETGSVHVAKLMDIESFATVHQMVSTIRGTLDSGCDAVDVLKACFPGGSMTGAPKIRTMELLDRMEEGASRGPYSGSLGYISLNGSMDMNIIIRTAVLTPSVHDDEWNVRVGAGGAITALSESSDEYEEMMLKASAVLGAVKEWASGCDKRSKSQSYAKSDAHIALKELNITNSH